MRTVFTGGAYGMVIGLMGMNAVLASMFVVDSIALSYFHPLVYIALRTIPAGALWLAWYATHIYGGTHWPRPRELFYAVAMSLSNVYLANIFILKSLETISAAKSSLIYNAKPFLIAILAHYVYGERITRARVVGLTIGWLGLVPLILYTSPLEGPGTFLGISSGEWWAFAGASAVAISYMFSVEFIHDNARLPLSFASGMNLFIGGLAAAVTLSLYNPHAWRLTASISMYGWMWLLCAIAQTIVWSVLFSWCMRSYRPSFVAASSFSVPLFAFVLEWLCCTVQTDISFWLSLVITSLGLYLFCRDDLKCACAQSNPPRWCSYWMFFGNRS